jgi:hypothetical protein
MGGRLGGKGETGEADWRLEGAAKAKDSGE